VEQRRKPICAGLGGGFVSKVMCRWVCCTRKAAKICYKHPKRSNPTLLVLIEYLSTGEDLFIQYPITYHPNVSSCQ
jgi:hypothetical protein